MLLKCQFSPNGPKGFNAIPSNIPGFCFEKKGKKQIIKFIWKYKGLKIAKEILKNKLEG